MRRPRSHEKKIRTGDDVVPKASSLESLSIPSSVSNFGEETFLLHDSGSGSTRFLVFGTQEGVRFLSECDIWLSDGTFRGTPSLFYQTYSVHGFKNNTCVACMYCLLPNKTKDTYFQMWQVICDLLPLG